MWRRQRAFAEAIIKQTTRRQEQHGSGTSDRIGHTRNERSSEKQEDEGNTKERQRGYGSSAHSAAWLLRFRVARLSAGASGPSAALDRLAGK
jgi:hypothetical protein